jgi:para-nitrobenzyl esterase
VTDSDDGPVVGLAAGRVRGMWRSHAGHRDAAFLGIPYALPPTGDRRFAAPVPVPPWDGIRDATQYGATPQRWVPDEPTLIPEPAIPGDDTLNVNVFTPRPGETDAGLPVLVWIHGGGYVSGSSASPWYDGRAFTRDGVVVVSISYRLGFDGFGWIEGTVQNRGLRDQLLALAWVRHNVAAFGGDSADVTIAGQSAGGGSVLTLLGMPAAQGLFHRAIAISSALADIPESTARATSARLAAKLGVAADLAGFRSRPEKQVQRHQVPAATRDDVKGLALARAALEEAVPYGPVIDGDLLTRPTVDALAEGVGGDIPLVVGATDDEFTMITEPYRSRTRFVPGALALGLLGMPRAQRRTYTRTNRGLGGTARLVGRYVTDRVFRTLVVRVARARAAASAPAWVYRFVWRSPARGIALHCLDVPFWFDRLDAERVDAIAGPRPPQALADALHGTAVAFLREGDPGWTPWSASPGTTRFFGGAASAPDVRPHGYASVDALL